MQQFPAVKTEMVSWGFRDRVISPGHKAIVNPDTEDIYSVTSKHYKLVKHEDVLDAVVQAVEENPEYGRHESSVWLSDNGAKMHTKLRFPDVEFPIDQGGDKVNPTVEIFNSYDGSWALKILFGAFRLVCSNGLVVGKILMNYRRKHISEGVNQEKIRMMLGDSLEKFSYQTNLWKSWADRVTTVQDYEAVMGHLPLSEKDREEIGKEVEVSSNIRMDDIKTKSLTYWLFYNILSAYVTHKITSEVKRVNIENAMRNYFG